MTMKQEYRDITSRMRKPPLWWDEEGVPRYEPFRPDLCNNIYAEQAALLEIACQRCGRTFLVARTDDSPLGVRLHRAIRDHSIGYGDPPYDPACPAGNTMSSDTLCVMQFWCRKGLKWKRVPKLEIRIDRE